MCVGYFVLVNFLFIATAGAFGCTGHRLLVDQHTVNSLIFSAICAWWGFPSRLTNPLRAFRARAGLSVPTISIGNGWEQ